MNTYLDGLVPQDVSTTDLGKEVPELLRRGESAGLEFKSSMRWDYQHQRVNKELERAVAKTIAGFLNARGGTLLIGVDDDGEVLGLERDFASLSNGDRDAYELHLMQVLTGSLGGSIAAFLTVTFHQVDGKDVCQIAIEPSDHPIYLTEGQGAAMFVRTGNATRSLPVNEAIKYVRARWGPGTKPLGVA
jgi:predicted HTH transcriptional regulator